MQLSELVKNYSINTISQKTNIPNEVLEKLINSDWENLQRAKVNGFLSIIEREFSVDLSEIKSSAKEFYSTHEKSAPQRPIDLVDAETTGGSGGKIIANIFTILIVALVAYAGWFYLAKSSNSDIQNDTNATSGMFNDSIDAAKKLVGILDKKEDNSSKTTENKEKEIAEEKAKEESKVTQKSTATVVNESTPNTALDNNTSSDERVSKKFDITIGTSEKNSTSQSSNEDSKVGLDSIPKSNSLENEKNSSSKIKSSVDALLEENDTNSIDSNTTLSEANTTSEGVDVKLDENITTEDSNLTLSEENSTLEAVNKITITPTVKKIWIGIYNLKTKKRVVKVATSAYDYNTNGGDVAIVTGHSRFKIATNSGANSEYHDSGKKKYLLITKDGIKVLTRKEYKKVTNRRAW